LNGDTISFFQNSDIQASASVETAAKHFLAALKLKDVNGVKNGLCHIHSIVRGNIALYGALCGGECVQSLQGLIKANDPLMCDKAASLLTGVMCRYPGKFTIKDVNACVDYPGTEAG